MASIIRAANLTHCDCESRECISVGDLVGTQNNDTDSLTPVGLAARLGELHLLTLLVEACKPESSYSDKLLLYADILLNGIRAGQEEIISYSVALISQALQSPAAKDGNAVEWSERDIHVLGTVLLVAVELGHCEAVRLLLEIAPLAKFESDCGDTVREHTFVGAFPRR